MLLFAGQANRHCEGQVPTPFEYNSTLARAAVSARALPRVAQPRRVADHLVDLDVDALAGLALGGRGLRNT